MIDVASVAKDVAAFLVPALPYLVKAGEKAVEEVGKRVGGDAMEYASDLWRKLRPKAEPISTLQSAINDAAAAPQNEDARAQLRVQLKKLLAEDEQLAKDLQSILADAKQAGVTVIVSGDRSVGVGGDVAGSTIITGDQNEPR